MAQTSRLVLEIDSRDAEQKAADTRKALEVLEDAGLRVKPAMDKASQGLKQVGDSSEKAGKQVKTQAEQLEELLGAIDPVTRKLGELDKQEKELAKNRKLGLLDADTFNEYQGKINATRTELGRFNADMTKTGMSAKATAAALRGVPAQFTDIAVSLQGGQAPLTVFLQQGGQLKDMFGGIGPAAKALGGYIVGLINPLTVAAASAAALTAVFVDAEREVSAFNKALFSGSASSGQTATSLSTIAKNAAALTGSLSESKAAVIALAASAGLSQVQFKNLAEAASAIGEFTGKSAGEVAAALGGIGDNATKAAEKISSQYGLLTSAQYDVIRGLDDQGRKQEALDVLSESLNQNAQARFKRYRESLSDIERDWNDIGKAISNAYSQIRGELFPDSAKQIEIIERILQTRKDGGLAGAVSTGLSKLNGALGLGEGENDDSTEALQKRLSLLKLGLWVNQQNAETEGKATKANQDRIEADSKWNALAKKEMTDQAKLAKDIADARKLGVEAGKSQADIDKVVADIQAKYDKAQAKPKAYTEDAGQKMLDEARQRFAVLQQQGVAITNQTDGTKTLGTEAKKLIELETMLADLKSKATLTASQKQILAMGEMNLAQQKINAGKEKENQITSVQLANAEKLQAYQDNINSQLEASQQGLNNKIAGAGLSDEARSRLMEDLQIQQDYQRKVSKLTSDYNNSTDKSAGRKDLYDSEVAMEKEALAKRLAQQKGYYAAVDAEKDNWLLGTSTAWQNYLAIATDYNKQAQQATADLLSNTTTSISDQIQGILKGTTSLGDAFGNLAATMANSVLGALSDIAAKWVVVQALKMAGITAETGAVVASESTKAAAKVAGDSVATASTLSSLAATVAANVSAAATTVASWLPAALVASIGSFGAAAVVGGTALVAAYALLKGFSSGGYTGPGGVNEPAGLVHKGEVVWSQADVKRSGGVASVEALRKGNVTPISAAARSSASSATSSTTAASQSQSRATVVNLYEDASRAGQVSRTQMTEQDVVAIYVANIRSEGDIHQANQSKYGLTSKGY